MVSELNIFKKTEEILMFLTQDKLVDTMPKIWRHILYPRLVDAALDLHELVYHANAWPEERVVTLQRYLKELSRLQSLANIAHARKVLTHKQIGLLDEMIESANKQAAAWRKSTREKEKAAKKQQDDVVSHGGDRPDNVLAGVQP